MGWSPAGDVRRRDACHRRFHSIGLPSKSLKGRAHFDTTGIPLKRFMGELCTTARLVRVIEGKDGTTIYVGGVNSPWQLKLYGKTDSIVRVEFMLQSTFLRKHGIVRPHELSLSEKDTPLGACLFP